MASLRHIQGLLASELDQRGFTRQEHPNYSPHITIAKIKRPLPASELTTLQQRQMKPFTHTATWTITMLDVMKSELVRPAARYTTLASYPLGG